jgi:hypothetical protein
LKKKKKTTESQQKLVICEYPIKLGKLLARLMKKKGDKTKIVKTEMKERT